MRASHLDELECPIARTIGLIGDVWSLMIIRELFLGSRRFDQIEAQLRASTALLSERLKALEAMGIVRRKAYQASPPRYEYHLTSKGIDLWPVMVGLKDWGDRWGGWADEPPAHLRHQECGGLARLHATCDCCSKEVTAFEAILVQAPPMKAERARLADMKREQMRGKAIRRSKAS